MNLELEFIHRRRLPIAAMAFLLLTLLWCGIEGYDWWRSYEMNQLYKARIASLESELQKKRKEADLRLKNVDPKIERSRLAQEAILKSLQYPWARILLPIEQGSAPEVAILSFTHEQATGVTRLEVEALDAVALLKYVGELNAGNDIPQWRLTNYRMQTQTNPPTVKGEVLQSR